MAPPLMSGRTPWNSHATENARILAAEGGGEQASLKSQNPRDRMRPHFAESWQNGYCTGLENRRPKGHGGSNPSLSAISKTGNMDSSENRCSRRGFLSLAVAASITTSQVRAMTDLPIPELLFPCLIRFHLESVGKPMRRRSSAKRGSRRSGSNFGSTSSVARRPVCRRMR